MDNLALLANGTLVAGLDRDILNGTAEDHRHHFCEVAFGKASYRNSFAVGAFVTGFCQRAVKAEAGLGYRLVKGRATIGATTTIGITGLNQVDDLPIGAFVTGFTLDDRGTFRVIGITGSLGLTQVTGRLVFLTVRRSGTLLTAEFGIPLVRDDVRVVVDILTSDGHTILHVLLRVQNVVMPNLVDDRRRLMLAIKGNADVQELPVVFNRLIHYRRIKTLLQKTGARVGKVDGFNFGHQRRVDFRCRHRCRVHNVKRV